MKPFDFEDDHVSNAAASVKLLGSPASAHLVRCVRFLRALANLID